MPRGAIKLVSLPRGLLPLALEVSLAIRGLLVSICPWWATPLVLRTSVIVKELVTLVYFLAGHTLRPRSVSSHRSVDDLLFAPARANPLAPGVCPAVEVSAVFHLLLGRPLPRLWEHIPPPMFRQSFFPSWEGHTLGPRSVSYCRGAGDLPSSPGGSLP